MSVVTHHQDIFPTSTRLRLRIELGNTNSGLKLRSVFLKWKTFKNSTRRHQLSCFEATERLIVNLKIGVLVGEQEDLHLWALEVTGETNVVHYCFYVRSFL